jgi:hypothetical protein
MAETTRLKRCDLAGVVHYAHRPNSVFSACTQPRPAMEDHTVALAWPGDVAEDAVVTCLACLVLE